MSADPILASQIARPGQSQGERLPEELGPHFADVDARTPAELLAHTRALAATIPFVPVEGDPDPQDPIRWSRFFAGEAGAGSTPAPQALFRTFLTLYDQGPRAAIDRLTEKHLDFFYRRVLGFVPRGATPDRAHAIVALKKGAPAVRITPAHVFSAGKDASGVEQTYAPTTDVVVNGAQVASLRSIFVDGTSPARVRFAPVADSSDGLGGALPDDATRWRPFGHPGLPIADIGFAVSSPVLRLKEGSRTITLSITATGGIDVDPVALGHAFEAFLTGEKQWLGPYGVTATVSGAGLVEFRVEIPGDDPAITDYDAKTHALAYTTAAPVLQMVLKPDAGVGCTELANIGVSRARITVDVRGLTSLTLESDAGTLDPQKAFLPFGTQPGAGSRFLVGCDEALSKSLSRLDLRLQWKDAPASFATQYQHYAAGFAVSNGAFTVQAVFRDRTAEHTSTEALFDASDARKPFVMGLLSASAPEPAPREGGYVFALNQSRTRWGRLAAEKLVRHHPRHQSFLRQPPDGRRGYVAFSLDRGFLHKEYRQQSVAKVIARIADPDVALLNEPYTPVLQGLSLDYTAHSADVDVSSVTSAAYAELDVVFFHVGAFGQMRDHGHQRAALGLTGTVVPLVPSFDYRGELLIGLSGLAPGDGISLLFQVAEGSADPEVAAQRPEWFVLCDNYWKPLGADGVVHDTTNLLLASGVVAFVIPKEATVDNTILPPGFIWLKGGLAARPEAASQMVGVAANAVEVQWVMRSEDDAAAHLATALPPGSLARLLTPVAQVAKVTQPYASFGGAPRESGDGLRTRAAERLRHRNRASAAWDYERLILEAFPSVHRVKCIPHARPGSWMAPGHVLVVVVPDLRNTNAPDPLEPKVDADTLARITAFLNERATFLDQAGPGIVVTNPDYRSIALRCRVKFRRGFEFNFYRAETVRGIVRALSPWAFDSSRPLEFGGRVYASTLLNFVEELPQVDYVTDFSLLAETAGGTLLPVEHAEPSAPDVMLVSSHTHDITEAE